MREPYNLNKATNALLMNRAVGPNNAVVRVWHTTALFGDPYCSHILPYMPEGRRRKQKDPPPTNWSCGAVWFRDYVWF